MTMNKIPDIAFEFDGEFINLEQDIGSGEVDRIQLHRTHLAHIAGKLGIPVLDASAERIRSRLQMVADRLYNLAVAEHYRSEIIERCGCGGEFLTELDVACDLAADFLNDLAPQVTTPAKPAGATAAVQAELL